MALIDPFRKLIVYPSLLRSVCASWNKAFGTAELTLVWRHIAALPSQPVSQFGKRLLAGLAKLPNDFGNKTRNKLGTKPKTARWSKISKNQWRNGLVILGKPVSS
jgi:hypothetical protein